jgi:hypothetical protein
MNTKLTNWMLMAAVVLGLGMSVTSCKDDDDDKGGSSEKQQAEQAEKTDAFWGIVGQLTSIDNYTIDYQDKTFEPTIGEPLEGNSTVRVVATNDMASAAARFASLVGVSIDPSTSSYTYTNDAVGTLTYTKTDNGQSWATVDVNIKQLPKLQQIIYRSPEQGGTNASMEGTCYYRFGDVVKKTYTDKDDNNKQKTEYWVCVRPAFNPEGKGDSHWITLSPLPKKNIWEYTTKNNVKYALPTGISKNEEQMQNLAEMLYAIAHPYQWEQNVRNNPAPGIFSSGLRMFHDFNHNEGMVAYHSAWFWKRVAKAWEESNNGSDLKNIYQLLFGEGYSTKEKLSQLLGNGLNLLAKGYSWWTSSSNSLSLYQYTYKNGENNECNMHQMTYKEVKKDYTTLEAPLNVNNMEKPYIVNEDFFGDDAPRYIIRHATGKELAGFKPNLYATMGTTQNGITDVYTYNTFYNQNVNQQEAPEELHVRRGYLIGKDGKFYVGMQSLKKANTEPVAMVMYVGFNADTSDDYNGLAISMKALENWTTWSSNTDVLVYPTDLLDLEQSDNLNGVNRTFQLGGDEDHYPAAKAALNYKMEGFDPEKYAFSHWFLPTVGQIVKILEQWKIEVYKDPTSMYHIYDIKNNDDNLNMLINTMIVSECQYNDAFWTSTDFDQETAVYMKLGKPKEGPDFLGKSDKENTQSVRPFIAF